MAIQSGARSLNKPSSSENFLSGNEDNSYLWAILISLLPYAVTVMITFQYIARSGRKVNNDGTKTKHTARKTSALRWILFWNHISFRGIRLNCSFFWREFTMRVWILYVECFYIPKYRKEWHRYSSWRFSPEAFIEEVNEESEEDEESEKININLDPAAINLSVEFVAREMARDSDSEESLHIREAIRHDHSQCEIITICVNGLMFETQKKTLARFPFTLLGNEVLRERYYDPVNRFYFLDRNRIVFDSVLYYYQSGGVLRRPENIPLHIFMEDIEFYQLEEHSLVRFRDNEYITEEKIPDVPAGLLSRKLWCLFEFSGSSTQARIVAFLSFMVVIISLVIFCVDTLPAYNDDYTIVIVKGEALAMKQFQGGMINFQDPIDILEFACVMWFCFEILIRFLSCPSNTSFFTDMLNITDIVSVIPWFVTCGSMIYNMVDHANKYPESDLDDETKASDTFFQLLKATRLIRVLRILKLSRHSSGLQILGKTLMASVSELFMLVFFVVIGVLVFASVMYFAEYGEPETPFISIPAGFWWAVCTMTTVGYGDDVPKGVAGKIVGTIAALAGLLTIALPVPVIVNNFKFFCNQNFNKSEVSLIQTNHVTNCPYRPEGQIFHVEENQKKRGPTLSKEYKLLKLENRELLKQYLEAQKAQEKINRKKSTRKFVTTRKSRSESPDSFTSFVRTTVER